MFRGAEFTVTVLMGILFSSLVGADNFQNSCVYSVEKAVYNITPTCSLSMFQDETILQYGNAPIDDIERCTADSALGPMTVNEVNELLTELRIKVFAVTGGAPIESKLSFDADSQNLRGLLSMNINGDEDLGSFSVPATQISDGVLRIGDLEANMRSPYVASFWAEDALEVYLTGTCVGPYFQNGT